MRLANVRGRATIVVEEGMGLDVDAASGGRFGPALDHVYDRWDEFVDWAAGPRRGAPSPFTETDLGSPVPAPRQVFAIGMNYRAHAEEAGIPVPDVPATFTKFPACVTGPYDDIVLPNATVDWEVELVAVIGARADRVAEADAWQHVAGLTVGQDLSDRTLQFAAASQFSLGKSYRGFAPMGPCVVTADELDDPTDLALGCSIDGEVVQDARSDDLVFDVARLVAELSAVVPLLPGDVIFTGTPGGVGFTRQPPRFLEPGQVLETWIEGIGRMRNRLVAP